jgi:hypothetical protein
VLGVFGVGVGLYAAWQSWWGAAQSLIWLLMALLLLLAGVQLVALGIIGEYVGRAYLEVRQRPRYTIQEVWE